MAQRQECEALRARLQRGGVDAHFDPLRVTGAAAALEEAERESRHADIILTEMENLMAAQAVDEEELKAYADEAIGTIPGKYRVEVTKLLEINRKLKEQIRRGSGAMRQTSWRPAGMEAASLEGQSMAEREDDVTPRPDWGKLLATACPQLADRPISSSQGAGQAATFESADYKGATQDRARFVLALLGQLLPKSLASDLVSDDEYFQPLGEDNHVPAFLRSKTPVRNSNISKRDTQALIRAIWSDRTAHNAAVKKGAPKVSFNEHVLKVIRQKVGNQQKRIAEAGMNLMDGCRRYTEDAQVEMFKLVVEGKVDEEVVDDQNKIVQSLRAAMRKADADRNGGKFSEHLPVDALGHTVRVVFPAKNQVRVEELLGATQEAHPTGVGTAEAVPAQDGRVRYELLFKEDANSASGPFLEAVRSQYLQERNEFLAEVCPADAVLRHVWYFGLPLHAPE